MEEQLSDFKMRVEEHVRSINDLTIVKNKLTSETSDNAQRLEEAENKVCCLNIVIENLFVFKSEQSSYTSRYRHS